MTHIINQVAKVFTCTFAAIGILYGSSFGQDVFYTGSVQYSTGNYIFTDRTNSYYVFSGLTITGKRFQFSANIPIIYQNTPLISYTGGIMMPSGGNRGGTVIQRRRGKRRVTIPFPSSQTDQFGVGDPMVRLEYTVIKQTSSMPAVQIAGSVKPPVASYNKGFGTGEWDYSGGLSISKRFGSLFAFTTLDYWIFGDPPDLDLKNALSYGFALGNTFGHGKVGLLASLSGYSRIIQDVTPPVYLGIGLSYFATKLASLNTNLSFGLTESTPNFSISFGWRFGL